MRVDEVRAVNGKVETGSSPPVKLRRWIDWVWSIAIVALLTFTLRANGLHFVLSTSCLVCVVTPWYLGGWAKRLWLPFVGRGVSGIPRGIRRNPGPVVVTAIAVVASFVPGCALERHREETAMQWGDGLIFAIESHHSATGRWPVSMSDVADVEHAPALVRDGYLHYRERNDGFELDLWSEGDLIFPTGWCWDTHTRAWHRYD